MAIENEEKIPASRNIGVAWLFLITIFGLAIGWMARPALEQAAVLAAAADPEKVYFVVTEVFFHPLVAGVLLCGVVAAVMSTADSQLLLGSAVTADDLPVLRRVTNSFRQRPRIWLGRLLLVVIGLVSMAISMYKPDSILDLVVVCLWRNGSCLRSEHLTRPVLEEVQFLGSRVRCSRWDGRIVHLGLCFRRPGRCLEHNGRHARVCGGRGLCGGSHAIDTRAIIGSCGPL